MPISLDLPPDDRSVGSVDPPEDTNRLIRAATALATAHNAHETSTADALATKVSSSDPRLTDARTPTAHEHVQADVTDLPGITIDTSVGTRVLVGSIIVYADTGWRILAAWDASGMTYGSLPTGLEPRASAGSLQIRRTTDRVMARLSNADLTETAAVIELPSGFRPSLTGRTPIATGIAGGFATVFYGGTIMTIQAPGNDLPLWFHASSGTLWEVPAASAWPTTLPGTPA